MALIGVDVSVGDPDVVAYLDERRKEAAYWPALDGPGSVLLRANPSRAAVLEETYHAEQHRRLGWAPVDDSENCQLEIEAQLYCIEYARRQHWTKAEIKLFRGNLLDWRKDYVKAIRRGDGFA